MRGLITLKHASLWEQEFPGILALYEEIQDKDKPGTFLELVNQYLNSGGLFHKVPRTKEGG